MLPLFFYAYFAIEATLKLRRGIPFDSEYDVKHRLERPGARGPPKTNRCLTIYLYHNLTVLTTPTRRDKIAI